MRLLLSQQQRKYRWTSRRREHTSCCGKINTYSSGIWWYHHTFGDEASKCTQHCRHKTNRHKGNEQTGEWSQLLLLVHTKKVAYFMYSTKITAINSEGLLEQQSVSFHHHVDAKSSPSRLKLLAASGTHIRTYGTKDVILNTGMRRNFTPTFIQPTCSHPFYGTDFWPISTCQWIWNTEYFRTSKRISVLQKFVHNTDLPT